MASRIARLKRDGLIVLLLLLSGAAGATATEQYVILQTEKQIAVARQQGDEIFLKAIKALVRETNTELDNQLAHQKTIAESFDSSAMATIRNLEKRAIADMVGWFVVLFISAFELIRREKSKSDIPSTTSWS